DTDVVFEAVAESGLRATIGKCMMDFDAQVPARLQEATSASIDESLALRKAWHGTAHGRPGAALAPPFALSRSRAPLRAGPGAAGGGGEPGRPAPGARSHACVGVARRDRDRQGAVGRTDEPRVPRQRPAGVAAPVRGALRLGGRPRAAAPGRPPGQGDALSRL